MDGGAYGIYFVFTHPSIGLSPASKSWLLKKHRLSFATTKNPLPKRVLPKLRSQKLLLRFLSYPTQGGSSPTQLNLCSRMFTLHPVATLASEEAAVILNDSFNRGCCNIGCYFVNTTIFFSKQANIIMLAIIDYGINSGSYGIVWCWDFISLFCR